MDQQVNYGLNFIVEGNDVTAAVAKLGSTVTKTLDGITASLKRIQLDAILNQIDRVANGLGSLAKPGMDLSTSMGDLQAITGLAGQKLKEIEGYARSNAKTFGGSAAESVEAYKLILSQLGPEIAQTPAALQAMGNSVSVLSKTMGGDAVAATEVLTTAMNQYQVSLEDPTTASQTMADMMNIMAAAAKEGSAELPQIKSALEQSGMAAKTAGVGFDELNAAIQVLDKAGKKGSEGGVAIRNVLATLSEGRFLPKETQKALVGAGVNMSTLADTSIPLARRLQALTPIMQDQALVTKLFGKENSNAAIALLSGIPEMERLTTAINGTKTAYEQAAGIMETPAEKAKRLQSNVDELKIALFAGTDGLLGYASVIGDITRDFTNLWPAIEIGGKILGGFGTVLKTLTSATKMYELGVKAGTLVMKAWTGVQGIFNAVMAANPISLIVIGIFALIAAISYVVYAFDGWGAAWGYLMDFIGASWEAFKESFNYVWLNVQDSFLSGIEVITKAWYKLQSLWDEEGSAAGLAKIESKQNDRAKAIAESYGKIEQYEKKAAEAVSKVFGKDGLHANGNGVGDLVNSLKKTVGFGDSGGISEATVPGASGAKGTGGTTRVGGVGGVGTKTNQAIATGGTKNTTVNVTIGNGVGTINLSSANLPDGAGKIRDIIVDEITRAIAMGASLGGAATS